MCLIYICMCMCIYMCVYIRIYVFAQGENFARTCDKRVASTSTSVSCNEGIKVPLENSEILLSYDKMCKYCTLQDIKLIISKIYFFSKPISYFFEISIFQKLLYTITIVFLSVALNNFFSPPLSSRFTALAMTYQIQNTIVQSIYTTALLLVYRHTVQQTHIINNIGI